MLTANGTGLGSKSKLENYPGIKNSGACQAAQTRPTANPDVSADHRI